MTCEQPISCGVRKFPYIPDLDREFLFLGILNSPSNRCHDRMIKHLAVVVASRAGLDSPTVGRHSLLFPLVDLDLDKFLSNQGLSRFESQDLIKELVHLADACLFQSQSHTWVQLWNSSSHYELRRLRERSSEQEDIQLGKLGPDLIQREERICVGQVR